MTQPNKSVFVSYRSTDRAAVERLVQDLSASGEFSVWYDRSIVGGQKWWDEILANIRKADVMILALSPAMLGSEACRLEREYASILGLTLLPVQIERNLRHDQVDPSISSRQIIPYYGGKREFDALVTAVRAAPTIRLPNPLPTAPPSPQNAPRTAGRSTLWFIGGALALIAIIAVILIAGSGSTPPSPTITPSQPESTSTSGEQAASPVSITSTPSGSAQFHLIYESPDAFTVLIDEASTLEGITLQAAGFNRTVALQDDFDILALQGFVFEPGMCFRYLRASGDRLPAPDECSDSLTFQRPVAAVDVFWYSDNDVRARDVVVLNRGEIVATCSLAANTRCAVRYSS